MSKSLRQQLRQTLRQQRNELDANEACRLSTAICARLTSLTDQAQHVAGYLPLGKEVDLQALQHLPEFKNASYYVPVVLPHFQMLFAQVDEHTCFNENRYGILEPDTPASQLKQASELDVVLVPLVGFDEQCNRMGMGGGYYDRCFEQRREGSPQPLQKPTLIGVAYDLQQVETVYPEHWDVPLDMIVTPSRTLSRKLESC